MNASGCYDMDRYKSGESGYTDNSPFVRTLRTEGRVRVIDALISNPERPLTVSDLMNKTGMARSTVLDNLNPLIDMGLVESAGRVGNADQYQVTDHEANKHLYNAQLALVMENNSRESAPDPESHEDSDVTPEVLSESFGQVPNVGIGSLDNQPLIEDI